MSHKIEITWVHNRLCMPHGNSKTQSHIHLPIHQDKPLLFNIIFSVFKLKPFSLLSPHSNHTHPALYSSKSVDMVSACAASSTIAAAAFSSPSSQTKASFLSGRKLRVSKYSAPATSRSFTVCATAEPNRPLWFPGSTPPPWLDGSLPGDFGFDPLGLASDPESLKWNQQAEIVHCRWAMLGAAGIFIPEFLTKIGILNTPSWYTAGEQEYFTDTTTLFVIELILIGWAEGRRWADIIKPGCVNTDPIFPNNKLTGTDVGYPGGLWFDPLGWGSGSPEKIKELRTKEIKNGRLAMLAVMGAWFQHIYTGTGPIDNLFAHLADPGHATVFAVSPPLSNSIHLQLYRAFSKAICWADERRSEPELGDWYRNLRSYCSPCDPTRHRSGTQHPRRTTGSKDTKPGRFRCRLGTGGTGQTRASASGP